jgi:hypothetical protein
MFEQLRDIARRLLMGPSKNLTQEEIAARLQAAFEDLVAAEADAQRLEAEFIEATAAPQVNESALAKAYRELEKARQAIQRHKDRQRVLQAMAVEAAKRARCVLPPERLREFEQLLARRLDLCEALEAWAREGAKTLRELGALNVRVFELLPDERRGGHTQDMFTPFGLVHHVGLRLYGYSNGVWMPRSIGLESPHTAIHGDGRRKPPTLPERAARENVTLLRECSPEDEPPRAA